MVFNLLVDHLLMCTYDIICSRRVSTLITLLVPNFVMNELVVHYDVGFCTACIYTLITLVVINLLVDHLFLCPDDIICSRRESTSVTRLVPIFTMNELLVQ